MSGFGLNAEHEEMKAAAIAFARKRLNYDAFAADRAGIFPREAWKACAEFGLQGLPIAEEFGGRGASPMTTIAVMEGLGYACRDRGLLFSINAQLWSVTIPIALYGTPEQKKRYLPGLCDGSLIGANAASEPEAGSDVFSMRTRAIRDGDAYILNGSKTFVSNGPVADLFLAYATLDPAKGVLGICSLIVDRQTAGVTVPGVIDKMGLRTSPMAQVAFDDARVPEANRVGREGRGAEVFNSSMEWERGCILASCLGAMQRQLEECIAYARQRKQFGQSIGKFQSVANRIVAMKLRLETARPLVYQIGWLKEQGRSAELEAAMAKLWVSETFVESCLDAIQIHGGYGFTTALPYERELRDAVGGTLYSGTSDIQRHIIATKLGL
jgi:alkylation response protein AidB-like acyl-CoA dehydrogenase